MATVDTIEAPPALMTAEEHLRHHGDGRTELVRGHLEERPVPGERHGEVAGYVYLRLATWGLPRGYKVFIEAGNVLERDPDTVRLPDVSAVAASKLPGGRAATGYGEVPPDLAVEVRSPGQSLRHLRGRMAEYAAAGTPLGWIVDPEASTVEVFGHGQSTGVRAVGESVSGGNALPGFECEVRLLMEAV